jgi:hypothetical protein
LYAAPVLRYFNKILLSVICVIALFFFQILAAVTGTYYLYVWIHTRIRSAELDNVAERSLAERLRIRNNEPQKTVQEDRAALDIATMITVPEPYRISRPSTGTGPALISDLTCSDTTQIDIALQTIPYSTIQIPLFTSTTY